jgi:hypothetical protein
MRTQSRDTYPEAERVLIELIRKAPMSKRFGLVRSSTATLLKANICGIQKLCPNASSSEIAQQFLLHARQRQQGILAETLETTLKSRSDWQIGDPDVLTVLRSMAELLEKHHISYYIGGSLASSLHGMQQLAQDIDIVLTVSLSQVPALIADMQTDYLIDEKAIYSAAECYTSFSTVHLGTLLKIDMIIPGDSPFEQQTKQRRQWHILDKDARSFPVSSPEDIVLIKLHHHQQAGKIPDDQWNDVLGVLKVQGPQLNLTYMEQWASHLKITDLLEQAYIDAGLRE